MAEAPMGTRFGNNEQQSTKFYIMIVLYVLKGQVQQEEAGGRVEVTRDRKTEDQLPSNRKRERKTERESLFFNDFNDHLTKCTVR